MEIVRKELTSSELYSSSLRYNATLDQVEFSNDGGATWVAAPGQDPRIVAQVPPPDTANPACDGAARITEHYQELVASFISGAGGGATTVITAFLLLLFPAFALLWVIIAAVVSGLLALGAEDVAEAFLGSEWDDFLCIIYCNIGADGFVTEAGFGDIRTAVNAQIGGTAATVLNLLMDMTGSGGMNDAAGQRTETGDCAECICGPWCYEWTDFSGAGWTIIQGDLGSPGLDATLLSDPPSYYNYVSAYYHMPNEEVNLRGIHIEFVRVDGTMDAPTPIDRMWRIADTPVNRFDEIEAPSNTSPYVSDTAFDAGDTNFGFTMSAGYGNGAPPGGSLHISLVRFSGIGALPSFTGGTDCS